MLMCKKLHVQDNFKSGGNVTKRLCKVNNKMRKMKQMLEHKVYYLQKEEKMKSGVLKSNKEELNPYVTT